MNEKIIIEALGKIAQGNSPFTIQIAVKDAKPGMVAQHIYQIGSISLINGKLK